jgi:endonuclease NucS-like protein
MKKFALWQRSKDGPLAPIEEASLELEEHLESWIADDPDLLQKGLKVVGRQVQLEAGPLDLLGIDPLGRWVVIEIKRDELDRKTVGQAIDYAACFSGLSAEELRSKVAPYLSKHRLNLDELLEQRGAMHSLEPEQRQVLLMVVGTGAAPGLERVASYLAEKHNFPISTLLFQVFQPARGQLLLAREVTEHETAALARPTAKPAFPLSTVMALAKQHGTQQGLQQAVDTAKELGLHARPYKTSVMFTPPSHGSRMLFTVWAKPKQNRIKAYVGVEPFSEFFPLRRAAVVEQIGREGYRSFTKPEFTKFLNAVKRLVLSARASSDTRNKT